MKRRSVKDVKRFVGWKALADLMTQFKGVWKHRNQQLLATAFLTGGRISEVLKLRKDNFNLKKDRVKVERMPLEKAWKKKGEYIEWLPEEEFQESVIPCRRERYTYDKNKKIYVRRRFKTEKVKDAVRRDFSFPNNEPFAKLVVKRVKDSDDLLFPSPVTETHLTRQQAYNIMRKIGKDITGGMGLYNHWFRAQRASCLVAFYEMSLLELMEWMGWRSEESARRYAKMGEVKLVSSMAAKQDKIPELVRDKWS